MEMHQRVGIAVAGLLLHDVDRFAVEVEAHHFRERNPRSIDPHLHEFLRQRLGCTHDVPAKSFERLFLHGHERAAPPPSCITFRAGGVFRSNQHVAGRRPRALRQFAGYALGAICRGRSNEQRAIRPNRSHNVARPGGEHQDVWSDFPKAHRFLRPARASKHRRERKPHQDRRAESGCASKTFHGSPPLFPNHKRLTPVPSPAYFSKPYTSTSPLPPKYTRPSTTSGITNLVAIAARS